MTVRRGPFTGPLVPGTAVFVGITKALQTAFQRGPCTGPHVPTTSVLVSVPEALKVSSLGGSETRVGRAEQGDVFPEELEAILSAVGSRRGSPGRGWGERHPPTGDTEEGSAIPVTQEFNFPSQETSASR